MATRIRLQRKGKKGKAFYHIVVADSRDPRDGKFIERLGYYDPTTNPSTIEIDFEKTLKWYQMGATPTETVRSLMSAKGILYKNHLLKGVAKGVITQEEANVKFDEWLKNKQSKINAIRNKEIKLKEEILKNRLKEETIVKEKRAAEISKKRSKREQEKLKETVEEENVNLTNESSTEEATT